MAIDNTLADVALEHAPEQPGRDSDPLDPRSASPDRLTWGERLGETLPLISAPALFGPPVIFLLGPWLLLVLLLIPPAALLITLVAVVLLAAGLLAAVGALIVSPYLLVRHLHRLARPAPAAGEGAFTQSVRARLHLTTR